MPFCFFLHVVFTRVNPQILQLFDCWRQTSHNRIQLFGQIGQVKRLLWQFSILCILAGIRTWAISVAGPINQISHRYTIWNLSILKVFFFTSIFFQINFQWNFNWIQSFRFPHIYNYSNTLGFFNHFSQ